jgi:protein-tyrosine phosphatase
LDVTLPDGTRIRALSIFERREHDGERDFGLYMDRRWEPTWPADTIEWEDFGLPARPEEAVAQIRSAFERARAGQRVEIGCLGGTGRTGTVLACMAVLAGVDAESSIEWVRAHYKPTAVETRDQEQWVLWFSARVVD